MEARRSANVTRPPAVSPYPTGPALSHGDASTFQRRRLTAPDLAPLARLDHAVDLHQSLGDQVLRGRAALAQIHQFQQVAQRDVVLAFGKLKLQRQLAHVFFSLGSAYLAWTI